MAFLCDVYNVISIVYIYNKNMQVSDVYTITEKAFLKYVSVSFALLLNMVYT